MDSTLAANLREIYHAASFSSKDEILPLVSNFSATRVYDSRYCWGRLWRWLYRIIDYATGGSWRQIKLQHTLVHTHRLFHQEMAKTQAALKQYVVYLEESGKGYHVEEEAVFSSRDTLSRWNRSVKPFSRLIQQGDLEKRIQGVAEGPLSLPLFTCPDSVLIEGCQKIIDTEGILAGPLPLVLLKKIIRKKPLSPIEQKEIKRWIQKMNKTDLDPSIFHRALETLHHLYVTHHSGPRPFLNLPELELFLEDAGCDVFRKKDTRHLAWRQKLEVGVQVVFDEKNLTLGKEVSSHSFGDDFHVYEVQEDPNLLALVAHHGAALHLHDLRMAKQPDIGVVPVRFKRISMDGKVALIERLQKLPAYQWSTSGKPIASEDQPLLDALVGFIQRCIQQGMTPIPCSSSSFMLNNTKQLVVVKPLSIGGFDFNALEDLVKECTADHPVIYQELMRLSGLDAHSVAKFYRDVTQQTLVGGEIAIGDLAAIYKITDPKVVDRAYRLIKRLKLKKISVAA